MSAKSLSASSRWWNRNQKFP